jgi:hypothetical protein
MEMRNALADSVIHRDEGPVRFQSSFDRARQKLGIPKKRADQIGRKIAQGLIMKSRNQEAMSRENRPVVEESDGNLVSKDHSGTDFGSGDPTK